MDDMGRSIGKGGLGQKNARSFLPGCDAAEATKETHRLSMEICERPLPQGAVAG